MQGPVGESRERQTKYIDLTGKRILVIDDHQTNRDILRLQLQSWHCIVEEAEDATAALKLLHQHAEDKAPFVIAFLDLQMPGMGGIAAMRRLRALDGGLGAVPVVALTAYAGSTDRQLALDAGMDAYLPKPIVVAEFYDLLRRLLPQGESGDG